MANLLTPGYLRWDGTKFVTDSDIEIVGPTGPQGDIGFQGIQGVIGVQGVQGSSYTPVGTGYVISNSGTPSTLSGTSELAGYDSSGVPITVSIDPSLYLLSGNTLSILPGSNLGEYLYWTGASWALGSNQVLLGRDAGTGGQGDYAIAIGRDAALSGQDAGAIAIGYGAASNGQGFYSIAIGPTSGANSSSGSPGSYTIAIGNGAGAYHQSMGSIAVGSSAAYAGDQLVGSIAIGNNAATNGQGAYSIALGYSAANTSQAGNCIAMGRRASYTSQQTYAISIGSYAAENYQNSSAIAIGAFASQNGQASGAIAIGESSAASGQNFGAIALGTGSVYSGQGANGVSIGYFSAYSGQDFGSVSLGSFSARNGQGSASIAIGYYTAYNGQGNNAIAIGHNAAVQSSSNSIISIGTYAGNLNQATYSIAIGESAGYYNQSADSISIGRYAGYSDNGANSIAIGALAGQFNAAGYTNNIILNASALPLNSTASSAFYVKPIRLVSASSGQNYLTWNSSSGEVSGTSVNWYQPSLTTNWAPDTAGSFIDLSDSSNNGVKFAIATGGTRTPTSGSLKNYEEGVWASTVTASYGTLSAAQFTGYYTRSGRLVYFRIQVSGSGPTTPFGGNMTFTLPFTPAADQSLAKAVDTSGNDIAVAMLIKAATSQLTTGSITPTSNQKVFCGHYEIA